MALKLIRWNRVPRGRGDSLEGGDQRFFIFREGFPIRWWVNFLGGGSMGTRHYGPSIRLSVTCFSQNWFIIFFRYFA